MKTRQELVTDLLKERMISTKVGIIVNDVDEIVPEEIVKTIGSISEKKVYAVIIGYGDVTETDEEKYAISGRIEQAVAWRNKTECAGTILVFIRGDVDKMHSLNVFDNINRKDVTHYAIELQTRAVKNENRPIREFWDALLSTAEYYSLQNIEEFISTVESIPDKTAAISNNLWRLNLLCDDGILGAKVDRKQRLIDNKNRIIDIAQISENGRKNLSKSLSRASGGDKADLQRAYKYVEEYSQYGERETLKNLDYETVESLLSAAKPKKKTTELPVQPIIPTPATQGNTSAEDDSDSGRVEDPEPEPEPEPPKPPKTLKKKDIDNIISDQILFGDEAGDQDIVDLYDILKDEYEDETKKKISISAAGGIFKDSPIELDKAQDNLRRLVGELCNPNAWGGTLEVKEIDLRDAIASNATPEVFSPTTILYPQDHRTLYDFLKEFDETFSFEASFQEIFDRIIEARTKLCEYIDFFMYNPYILLEANEEARNTLEIYIESWSELYSLYNKHEQEMSSSGSSGPTTFIGRGLIALDVLYVHTGDGKWKGMLMPLHPLYLWNYYEICKTVLSNKDSLGQSELLDVKSVLMSPPQMLNYLAVDKGITHEKDVLLPCSGSIQMLPTYENSTNRFLGDDGLEAIPDILERWIEFAPFSRNEVRICTVDTPNLSEVMRSIASFIEKYDIKKFIYDVYYTRGQNGNTDLASLDYADSDYNIGEYIKNGRLVLCIHSVRNSQEVQTDLGEKPVHIAFYFDQSKYDVQERPDDGKLYSNPFVVTYDFSYDPIMHTGSISPSARSQTGIVGDYHALMVSTSYINEKKSPWLCIDPSDSMDSMLASVKNQETQWLVIADRNIGSYEIKDEYDLIPLGEKLYDRRRVGVWASKNSRKIAEYQNELMNYNLSPDGEGLVDMIKSFGHIAATGLIGIPKASFDSRVTKYRQKGWFGTLFAATWYAKREKTADSIMIASLDTDKARTWLTTRDEEAAGTDEKTGQERADLIGLKYDKNSDTLFIQAIEVKTRDEENESQRDYELYCDEYGQNRLRGHAPKQVASIVRILKSIFELDEQSTDNFIAARREVLKYQIITECFRNIHGKQWQEEWHSVLSRAFEKDDRDGLNIVVSGILAYIRLGDASTKDSKPIFCKYDGAGEYDIELSVLTSHDIQKQVFDSSSDDDSVADIAPNSMNQVAEASTIETVTTSLNEPEEELLVEGEDVSADDDLSDPLEQEVEEKEESIDTDSPSKMTSGESSKKVPLAQVRLLLGEEPHSKEKFYWEFGNKKLNNRHLLINGNSGSGKTYCIEALLMEAALQGISAAVFDYTGGFTSKKLDPIFKDKLNGRIRQRLVRVEKIPINPFERHEIEIDEGVFVPEEDVDIASKIASTFASVYKMGDQQKSTVYSAVLSGLQKYAEKMNFRHLAEEMELINTSYSKTALSRIQQFIDIDPFTTTEKLDWSDIRDSDGTVYIFQFMGYGRDVQVMLTELLLWDLWSYSIKNGSEDKPFIYVIDEAQNLSHSEKSPSGMILTEGRKNGLSGWYATQFMKPQLDDDEIQRLQQADQKLYFCPPGEGVLTVAKNIDISAQGSKEWAERLQKLNKGECVTCGSMIRGGKWNKYDPRCIKITSLDERMEQ